MKNPRTQRVILAELSMSGVFHTAVNTGFIRWMRTEFPDAEISFFAERSHAEICLEWIEDQSVHFKKWPFFPRVSKYTLPFRDLLGCAYVIWLLLRSRKGDILFITNLLPATHWVVFGLNKLRLRPLYIALHGQLEALLPGTPLGFTKPYFLAIRLILRRDTSTRYVILGEPIRQEVAPFFSPASQLVVIDHPYEIEEEAITPPLKYPIRFGQPGVGNRGKGTQHLFRLGELLRDEIEAGKVELHLVGALDPELRNAANPWVKWHEKPLSENDYSMAIKELHYTLFLRDRLTGRATPSGSFFDTVKFGKPFLALDHPFIAHYADRFPGRGALCASVEELADAIRKILATC